MEFNEKLQYYRKQHNLTQEQLAEKLFVSRAAISKWESGKGYPNIESLKSISKLLEISIDDLLSSEEVVQLAVNENTSNVERVINLVYAVIDVMAVIFFMLPFYGEQNGVSFHSVTLYACKDISIITKGIYSVSLGILLALGILEFIVLYLEKDKWVKKTGNDNLRNWLRPIKLISVFIHGVSILIFIMTRQPYVTAFLFLFFSIKLFLLYVCEQMKRTRNP